MKVRMLRDIEVNGEQVAAGGEKNLPRPLAESWINYGICEECAEAAPAARKHEPKGKTHPEAELREKAVLPGPDEVA